MKKLKIAFVGLGKQFISNYFCFFKQLPDFIKIVAFCDIDCKKKVLSDRLNIKFYDNYQTLIDNEDIDVLILIMPHFLYLEVIRYAAKKEIHIFKEKPFAINSREAKELIELSNKYKIQIYTIMKRRYFTLYQLSKKYLTNIGKVNKIIINHVLGLENPLEGWRGIFEKSNGGCILDLGYHMIDIINWIFGLPDKVYAKCYNSNQRNDFNKLENSALIFFEYENNKIEGQLMISREHYKKDEEIIIIGEHGTINLKNNVLKIQNQLNDFKYHENKNKDVLTIASMIEFCSKIKNNIFNFQNLQHHLLNAIFIDSCYRSLETKSCENTSLIYKELYETIVTSNI